MYKKSYPLLLLIALLFSGCNTWKSLFKSEERTHNTPINNEAKVRLDPSHSENDRNEKDDKKEPSEAEAPKQKSASKKSQTVERPPMIIERPTMQFSAVESANIRLAGYSPFPSSGEMVVNLEELQPEFCYPYPGKVISPYGMRGRSMHSGMDIKAIPNDTIRAAMPGVVRMSKVYSGYGNTIVIRHYNGLETVYSHQSKNLVDVNDVVEAGAPIGLAGRTGRATTEHLHFEVRAAGMTINPNLLVDPVQQNLQRGKLHLYAIGGSVKASTKPLDKREDLMALEASSDKEVPMPETTKTSETSETSETPTATAAPKTTKATAPAAKSADTAYHTVKSGDTLSAIARRYGTTVPKICALNGFKANKVLQLKQKIRVK